MREIKNKICRDCELVALLEDDNGMELLVRVVDDQVWLNEGKNSLKHFTII